MDKIPLREKRSIIYPNSSAIIPPDITFVGDYEKKIFVNDDEYKKQRKIKLEQDPNVLLEHFVRLNYVERYIDANFQYGKCFINEIKKRYELPGIKTKQKKNLEQNRNILLYFS
jgi:hypothetical protein